jgi:ribosome biogenesis protein BMS1
MDEEVDDQQEYDALEKLRMIKESSEMIAKGEYVRITLRGIKLKHFKNFASKPVVIHMCSHTEDNMGFLMVRLKKHRFYTNLLKTNDPLIITSGFSKYQTIPVYARKDLNDRYRMIKYTP